MRAPLQRLAVGLSVVLLAGCAAMPDVASLFRPAEPAALGAAETAVAWPAADWWKRYDDAELAKLIDTALADNPGLQAAQARLLKARAGADLADAALWPKLDADIDATRRRFSEGGDIPPPMAGNSVGLGHARLNGQWEIDFFGRNRAALAAAVGQARAAEAEAQAARVLIASDVARRYFRLAALLEQRAIAADTLRQREAIHALVQARVKAGLDSGVELKQAEGALPDMRRDLGAIDEQIAIARHALAALTAQAPGATEKLVPTLAAVPQQPLPASLPADLVGRRADLVGARWRVEAALRNTDAARAAFYPNVNLIGLAGFTSVGLSNWFNGGNREWGLGAAIHLPIFDAGRLRAGLRGASADADAAVANYNETLINALREVADDIVSQQAIEGQQREQAQALQAAEAAFALARERYGAGIGNYLSVLATEGNVLTQRRLASDLKARHLDTNLQLVRALGGGYQASEQ